MFKIMMFNLLFLSNFSLAQTDIKLHLHYINGQENSRSDYELSIKKLQEQILSSPENRHQELGFAPHEIAISGTHNDTNKDISVKLDFLESSALLIQTQIFPNLSDNAAFFMAYYISLYGTYYAEEYQIKELLESAEAIGMGEWLRSNGYNLPSLPPIIFDSFAEAVTVITKKNFDVLADESNITLEDFESNIQDLMIDEKQIIIISHSQGNLYTNKFVRTFRESNSISPIEELKYLSNFQVATPASSILLQKGDMLTNNKDKILETPLANRSNLFTIPAIISNDTRPDEDKKNNHGFITTYLQDEINDLKPLRDEFYKRLSSLIKRDLDIRFVPQLTGRLKTENVLQLQPINNTGKTISNLTWQFEDGKNFNNIPFANVYQRFWEKKSIPVTLIAKFSDGTQQTISRSYKNEILPKPVSVTSICNAEPSYFSIDYEGALGGYVSAQSVHNIDHASWIAPGGQVCGLSYIWGANAWVSNTSVVRDSGVNDMAIVNSKITRSYIEGPYSFISGSIVTDSEVIKSLVSYSTIHNNSSIRYSSVVGPTTEVNSSLVENSEVRSSIIRNISTVINHSHISANSIIDNSLVDGSQIQNSQMSEESHAQNSFVFSGVMRRSALINGSWLGGFGFALDHVYIANNSTINNSLVHDYVSVRDGGQIYGYGVEVGPYVDVYQDGIICNPGSYFGTSSEYLFINHRQFCDQELAEIRAAHLKIRTSLSDPLAMTILPDLSHINNNVIPVRGSIIFYIIDWGDGIEQFFETNGEPLPSRFDHIYANDGTYAARMFFGYSNGSYSGNIYFDIITGQNSENDLVIDLNNNGINDFLEPFVITNNFTEKSCVIDLSCVFTNQVEKLKEFSSSTIGSFADAGYIYNHFTNKLNFVTGWNYGASIINSFDSVRETIEYSHPISLPNEINGISLVAPTSGGDIITFSNKFISESRQDLFIGKLNEASGFVIPLNTIELEDFETVYSKHGADSKIIQDTLQNILFAISAKYDSAAAKLHYEIKTFDTNGVLLNSAPISLFNNENILKISTRPDGKILIFYLNQQDIINQTTSVGLIDSVTGDISGITKSNGLISINGMINAKDINNNILFVTKKIKYESANNIAGLYENEYKFIEAFNMDTMTGEYVIPYQNIANAEFAPHYLHVNIQDDSMYSFFFNEVVDTFGQDIYYAKVKTARDLASTFE